jgi:two-component system, LytTR family, sensor kinase
VTTRGWVWLQLAVAWLPMWVLFTLLIVLVHETPLSFAAARSLSMIAPGALLGVVVYKFTERMPWPYPFRLRFVAVHVFAAVAYAVCWWLLISVIDSIVHGYAVAVIGPGISLFIVTGIWLYVVVAGVAYANLAAQRNARIEAQAARAQLDALRTQLHPHFLFNALHTVVQLIPLDPRGAARAAEQLAGALRTTIEERRDLVTLAEEWAFVERYLAIECIRFGERLVVDNQLSAVAREALLPSFSLQTLVENAVRHGAAPRAQPTRLTIAAEIADAALVVTVTDDGVGASSEAIADGTGTGLRRLRERMRWLYGDSARLDIESAPARGFRATLRVPVAEQRDEAAISPESRQ